MIPTIRQTWEESKVCQQIDLGVLQEVLPPPMIEELLETYQMWEERERKTNMLTIVRLPDRLARVSQFVAASGVRQTGERSAHHPRRRPGADPGPIGFELPTQPIGK